jgi:hypothetical protein
METLRKRLSVTVAACGLFLITSMTATVNGVYDAAAASLCSWLCPFPHHLLAHLLVCHVN